MNETKQNENKVKRIKMKRNETERRRDSKKGTIFQDRNIMHTAHITKININVSSQH